MVATTKNSEVVGLINWSLTWVRVLSWGLLVLMLQAIAYTLAGFFAHYGNLGIWDLFSGLVYGVLFIHLMNYQREGLRFVHSESDAFLSKALLHLNSYLFGMMILVAIVMTKWAVALFTVEARPDVLGLGGIAAVLIVVWLGYRREKSSIYCRGKFSDSRLNYGKRVLFRSFLGAMVTLTAALAFLFIGATGIGREETTQSIGIFLIGAGLLALGIAMALCWRASRDILRNPAMIYFERTLARFGFFWFISPLVFFFLFLGELLSR